MTTMVPGPGMVPRATMDMNIASDMEKVIYEPVAHTSEVEF